MDQELIQRSRYVLRSRIRRLQTCPDSILHSNFKQFYNWVNNHPLFSSLIMKLEEREDNFIIQIKTIAKEAPGKSRYDPGKCSPSTLIEHTSMCYQIIKSLSQVNDDIENQHYKFLIKCYAGFATGKDYFKLDEALEVIRDLIIDSLYEYLDEEIDFRNSIYLLLLKYKQRSEWFKRNRLSKYASDGLENLDGEKALAFNLQEYVLDQGVEFFVEPTSSSGIADLILRDSHGQYLIIDAKFIKEGSRKSNIIKKLADGFHQVYRYCEDYNEDAGYLVTFNQAESKISLDLDELHGFNYLKFGGKVIYHIFVNLAFLPSASKSGKAEEVIIGKQELIEQIK
ncbi:MAG: hypothetical protein WD607_06850 [Candidatus Paceibacterota bacterium]